MATMTKDDADAPETTHTQRQRPSRTEVLADMRKGAGQVASILAVVVTVAASVFAAILALHVVFVLFKATPTNTIVMHINSWAHDFAGPFRTLFAFHDKKHHLNVKLTDAVNYGVAAIVYLLGGRLLAGFLRRLAP